MIASRVFQFFLNFPYFNIFGLIDAHQGVVSGK